MDKKMRVLFLPTNNSGVNWWRMMLYFKQFSKLGVDAAMYGFDPHDHKCAKWEYEFARDIEGNGIRAKVFELMKSADAIILGSGHYPAIPPMVEAFVSKKTDVVEQTNGPKKMICEIDDWVHDTPEYNPAFKQGWKPGSNFEYVPVLHMMTSSAIVNATPWLADKHKMYNKNSVCMPNCIDFDWWNVKAEYKKNHSKKGVIRIGWAGGGNHDEDLRIVPIINRELQAKYGNKVEIVIIHGAPNYLKDIKGIRIEKVWCEIEKYPQMLANYKLDIIIAPLEVNKFNMGKSNLKWLESSALKTPCVATNIETYKNIEHGIDGFKCSSIGEWMENLTALIDSKELRDKIGGSAFARVFKDYNIVDHAGKYVKFLQELKI